MMKRINFLLVILLTSCLSHKEQRFDLRENSELTAAKEQAWGTCWAFASVSSIESAIIKEKKFSTQNLSEYYLDKFNGFNRRGLEGDRQEGWYSGQGKDFAGSNTDDLKQGLVVHLGGDYRMAAAALSNQPGIVQADFLPWIGSHHKSFDEFSQIEKDNPRYHYYYPRKVEWPLLGLDSHERVEEIKRLIKKYGAIASAQKMNEEPLGKHTDGLEIHFNDKEVKPDHSVSIIGWNDEVKLGARKGAWLIKDSDHKNEKTGKHIGYFYIMYDDFHVAKDELMGAVIFRDIDKRERNETIYSHALHGWRFEMKADEAANEFIMNSNQTLQSVGLYLLKRNAFFKIKIFRNDKLIHEQRGRENLAGFHQIQLNKNIKVKKGNKIKVAYSYDGAFAYDAPFEMEVLLGKLPEWGKPVFVNSSSTLGQSFYKEDGEWFDLTRKIKGANFAINLYSIPSPH